MRLLLAAGLLATLWGLALTLWLVRSGPAGREPTSLDRAAPLAFEPAGPEPAPLDLTFEPAPAPLRAESPASPAPQPLAPSEHASSAEPAPLPSAPTVSLDQLLRIPAPLPSGPQSREWSRERRAEEPEGDGTERRRRMRLDYSRERLAPGVPMQPERRRTDVGVAVRVDESDRLRVRGGVRLDEREATEAERELETTPTVGVEVRF